MNSKLPPLAALTAAVIVPVAAAQQLHFSPADKYAWCENVGWLNFSHAAGLPAGAQSPSIHGTYLAGFAWSENCGWVNLGDGTPANGVSYSNAIGTDCGVNINPNTGALTGMAWSENIGWLNFSGGALATPARPARLDFAASRFRGFVWGENIGWINLDDAAHFVGILCPADFNQDGVVDLFDYLDFLDAFVAGASSSDFNADAVIDFFDYLDFVNAFASGC